MYDLSQKLVASCEELYGQNIINDEQYFKCKTTIGDFSHNNRLNITEKKIFGGNRNNREKKYKDFIGQVETLINNIFININKNDSASNTTSEHNIPKVKWDEYYTIMTVLNEVIIDIIENVNKKSVSRYMRKEKSQYNQLLRFYNNIDRNRKEIDNIETKFKSLDKMYNIEDDKLKEIVSNTGTKNTIFVVLLVLNIIFLVILILIITKYK